MLVRLLQAFDGLELAPDVQPPDSLPPPEWKQAPGRQAQERFFPKTHLTMYAHVSFEFSLSSRKIVLIHRGYCRRDFGCGSVKLKVNDLRDETKLIVANGTIVYRFRICALI